MTPADIIEIITERRDKNLKEAGDQTVVRSKMTLQQKVCQRTAQELSYVLDVIATKLEKE